jgi:hypothetical protein
MRHGREKRSLSAVAYYRVSSPKQEKEGYSITAQRRLVPE